MTQHPTDKMRPLHDYLERRCLEATQDGAVLDDHLFNTHILLQFLKEALRKAEEAEP